MATRGFNVPAKLMSRSPLTPLLAALLACAGCISIEPDPTLSISTDPPGAQVLINGVDTGFATPCMLAVEDELMKIDVRLKGYEPEHRIVTRDPKLETRHWSEMNASTRTWRFPLWLNIHDLFNHPVREIMLLAPGRIFIRLDRIREDEGQ